MTHLHDHPEYQAFLSRIRATPDDDLPRLVFADWLEEHGERERAEFVRADIAGRADDSFVLFMRNADHWYGDGAITLHWYGDGAITLMHHVAEPGEWIAYSGTGHTITRRGFMHTVVAPLTVLIGQRCQRCHGEEVETPGCSLCGGTGGTPGTLRDLVRREPVLRVEASDRDPHPQDAELGWVREDNVTEREDHIPAFIYDLIPCDDEKFDACQWKRFTDRESAVSALSHALLAYSNSASLTSSGSATTM